MNTPVTAVPAAKPNIALRHFDAMLTFETDCWDVHESLSAKAPDFTLIDVRSAALFVSGHIPGAVHIPHAKMTELRMKTYPEARLFVVYCAGPHCNGANKAAIRLAKMGLKVKMMIGGITGWLDEGFTLATTNEID